MAYNKAGDCDRWSRIPFVVGMEVKRSNNPFGCEVCEALKGKYPKDFVFTGWHPQCRCYIVPVLASEEERMAYHRAVLKGEDVSDFHFKGEITEPHDGFKKWMGDNAERIENARSLPYWVRDNGKYMKGAATEPQLTVAMGGKDVHDQLDTSSTTIKNNLRVRDTMDMSGFNVKDTFPNGGKILVHELVSSDDSDYEKLIEVATFFAAAGKEVRLTPKMKRPPQFEYVSIYGSLVGTQYEHKCPDLLVDDLWYEHEGFITDNAKRAFGNMMNHGLKQSSRLIIDKPDLTDGFMIRSFYGRIKQGAAINEVWLRNPDGTFKLLFKNDKHLP